MGDRYIIEVTCECGFHDDEVPYAPTCGFKKWKCPKCRRVVNLAKYTGITKAMASNKAEIEAIIKPPAAG